MYQTGLRHDLKNIPFLSRTSHDLHNPHVFTSLLLGDWIIFPQATNVAYLCQREKFTSIDIVQIKYFAYRWCWWQRSSIIGVRLNLRARFIWLINYSGSSSNSFVSKRVFQRCRVALIFCTLIDHLGTSRLWIPLGDHQKHGRLHHRVNMRVVIYICSKQLIFRAECDDKSSPTDPCRMVVLLWMTSKQKLCSGMRSASGISDWKAIKECPHGAVRD